VIFSISGREKEVEKIKYYCMPRLVVFSLPSSNYYNTFHNLI